MGGNRGHDSMEDAQATGDLVRLKVAEKWKMLQSKGWKIIHGELIPLSPSREQVAAAHDGGLAQDLLGRTTKGSTSGKKRKKRGGALDGADDSTEDEEVAVGVGIAEFLKR